MSDNIGNYNKPYVSAVNLLDQREIWPKLIDRQDDAEWAQLMSELGRTKVRSRMFHFDSFYNDPKFVVIDTTGSVVTNSGTSTVTITGLQAGFNNYIKVGDTILFPDASAAKVGLVTAVSTTTLTNDTVVVQSVTGGNITLVTGNKITVNGTAMEEASNAPSPMRFNVTSIRNNIQIFSEAWRITDVQAGSERTILVDGSPYSLPQAAIDAMQLMRGRMAATYWSGEPSVTLFSDQSPTLTGPQGNAVQTTRGLDSYITTYGINPNVITPGQVTTSDIDSLCDQLTALKAPTDMLMVGGNSPCNVIDNYLMNLGSSGAQSVRLAGSNGETSFMATGFKKGGYSFKKVAIKLLSNPQVFNYAANGLTKNSIARALYILPEGRCPVYGGGENGMGNGGSQEYFQMRFCPIDPRAVQNGVQIAENGGISEFRTGALAGTNDSMYLQTRYYAQMGVEVFKPQVFAKWNVQ